MAWTRLWQFGAELRDNTEYTIDDQGVIDPTNAATKFRTGARSLQFSGISRGAGKAFSTSSKSVRVSYGLNHVGISSASSQPYLVRILSNANIKSYVIWNGNGNIEMYVDDALVASTNAAASGITSTDTWLEIGANFYASTSGFFTFYIDGAQVLTWSGDTKDNVVAVYAGGRRGANNSWGTTPAYIDDWYLEGSDVPEADFPPSSRFLVPTLPNGVGDNSSFTQVGTGTNNYEFVDDAPHDGDTTHVYANAPDITDTYEYANVTVPADRSVRAVITMPIVKKTDAGTDSRLKLVARDAVNADLVSDAKFMTTDYSPIFHRFELAPDGNAWDETKVNSAEFGYTSSGAF